MIDAFASDIADQMGIKLSNVSLVDGQKLGCLDSYILEITSKGETVGTLICKRDIAKLDNGAKCARLEVRIRASLSRLQALLSA